MPSDKPWLAHYPPGVPAEIDPAEHASLVALFEDAVARHGPRPAYLNMGVRLSYADLDRRSRDFAAYLQAGLGLQRGERVAIMMPNLLQYPIAVFGVLRAGLTVVNVNPLYTARELRHQLADSGAAAIVILENFAHVLEKVRGDVPVHHVLTTRVGDLLGWPKGALVNLVLRHVKRAVPPFRLPGAVPFPAALAAGRGLTLRPPKLGHEDLAFLQYTGGTTGLAKGAMLSHGNMVANVLQAHAFVAPFATARQEIIVTALPLYHIFALTANCLTFMHLGAANLLITNPRDLPGFVKALKGVPFSAFTGVNTLFNALLATPGFAELDFSHLRLVLGGGMAVQRTVAERWKAVTGRTIVEAYGLTETAPAACMNPLDLAEFNGSIGLPVPSTECSIRDDEGNPLPPGERGELCVRGPQVMRGYWNRPEETAAVLSADGWLRTGDMATMDAQGFFYIVDRKKDMILVSGFNVYPNEVEAVACEHPGVLEAAAVGLPDPRAGEVVKLVVVRRDPALEAAALIAFCRERLTGYKVPRVVEFRAELPKTPVGKILRRALRD